MKKIAISFMVSIMAISSIFLSGCSDKKYQVSQEEYEAAFSNETLSNVTISMTGPYWERDHLKEYYYRVGDSFAFCSYHDDLQYYGKFYEVKNGEEAYYLYGSEYFEYFEEEDAVWRKSGIMLDEDSYFRNAEFVSLYRKDFHLLEYDSKKNWYNYESTAYGEKYVYSYYFTDKKLSKFVITYEADNYEYVWDFYDYGTTKIPVEINDIKQNGQEANFFDIIDELEKSDIQKIETVEYGGSVQPSIRQPVEHKTTMLATDIETIYDWLKGLKENLTPISEQEAQVAGGGEIFLTISTDLGTVKISVFGRDYLRIGDKYFTQEGKLPDIIGETVTYTFESYSNKADIYMDIDDAVMVGTINFAFGEMVCKISDKTFSSKEFLLVADIGELTVYDGTHFLRNGTVYEIINDINFSQIIAEYFSDLESKIIAEYFSDLESKRILIETYASKYGEKVSIANYYGRYESGAIVAKMNTANTDAVWSETVGEHTIIYNNGNRITVLYNGEFYTLTEAYESGYLTENDISDIALKNIEFYPSLYNWDLIPPVVYGEKIEFNAKYDSSHNWNEDESYPSVNIIRSFTEFTAYCAEQGIGNVSYDETYFEDKYLLVVEEEISNSAAGHIVESVVCYGDKYLVFLQDNANGNDGATVMGERHCFIELDNSVSISEENNVIVISYFY